MGAFVLSPVRGDTDTSGLQRLPARRADSLAATHALPTLHSHETRDAFTTDSQTLVPKLRPPQNVRDVFDEFASRDYRDAPISADLVTGH